MANLANCLRKIGFSKAEAKLIKKAVNAEDGLTAKEAAMRVVLARLDEAQADKADIVDQLTYASSKATLNQGKKSRASINFQRGIGIDPTVINIGQDADLSSFIHEAGHFFLEVYADLASRPDAPESIKKEMATLLKWFDVPDLQTWHNMTLDEKRAHHEKFARGFEQYAFEGKAPRLDMVETFRTFRSWLTRVYRSIKDFINKFEGGTQTLNDDIRQVMDRMLATEEQIDAAQAARNYAPLFETQEAAGMTDAEWAEYQRTNDAAHAVAIEELEHRSMKDMQWVRNARLRAIAGAKKENEAKIREVRFEVAREVMAQPIYQVWQFLKTPPAKKQKPVAPSEFKPLTLEDADMRAMLAEMAKESGWAEVGGSLLRDSETDEVIGRTTWIPKAEWWPGRPGPKRLNAQQVMNAVNKALNGEMLKAREQDTVDYMIDWLNEDRRKNSQELEDTYVQIPEGQEIPSGKLSIPIIEEMYTEPEYRNIKARLGTGRYGMLMTEGMDPDEVAKIFRFQSGDAMVMQLMETLPPREAIDRLVDQRVLERYGDITSQKALEEAADQAVHNQARMRMLATELAVLSRRMGDRRALAAAAREAAYEIVNRKRVRDIKPNEFRASETRAAKNAEKAMKEGGVEMAAQAKRAQILNGYSTRMAYEALDEVKKSTAYLKKFEKEGTRKSIDSDYIDQIDAILESFDIRAASLKEIDRRKSLAEWIAAMEEQGYEPAIDEKLIENAKRKHYRDMTMREFREMVETVKHIEHLGRLKKKLLTAQDQREFAAITAEIKQSIEDNANRTVKARATPSDMTGMLGKFGRTAAAWHRKIASIAREMDGGQDGGAVWQYLIRPMNESGNNEVEIKMQAGEALAKLFEPIQTALKSDIVGNNLYARKRVVPETNLSMTREQRIMAVMNMGNAGNLQRLKDGGMEGHGQFTDTEIKAILDSLTEEEMEFVQGVWDYIETFRPAIAEQEKRLTGREPTWIEPTPLVTKYGTYRGGYFPAKYDADLSTRSDSLEAQTDLRSAMKGAMGVAAARNSYAKERAQAVVDRPILLSFSTISRHVNEVAHRLAWQDWITDANRLLKALDNPIREHYGPEILKAMRDTVQDIAKGEVGASNPLERFINRVRMGSTIVGLGWRITTGLVQFTGLSQSVVRIGGGYVARGMKEFVANPMQTIKAVMEESTFMRHRMDTQYREANEVLATVRAGEKITAFKASFFTFISKMQFLVDMPTYLGAKEKAYADLKLEEALDQDERDAIEKEAIARAEQAVLDSQGGGMLKDLAGAQRGGPYQKLWTNFYSYFNTTYQLNVESYRKTSFKNPNEVGRFVGDMLLINTVPMLATLIMYEILKGECDWDPECMTKKAAREQVGYMANQVVGFRDFAPAITGAMGGQTFGRAGPAGLSIYSDMNNLGTQLGQGEADLAFWKAANRVGGILLHYPAGQLNATMDGIVAIENGEVEGAEIPAALIAGAPK